MEILAMFIMLITRLLCSSQSSRMPMSLSLSAAIGGFRGGASFQAAFGVEGMGELCCVDAFLVTLDFVSGCRKLDAA